MACAEEDIPTTRAADAPTTSVARASFDLITIPQLYEAVHHWCYLRCHSDPNTRAPSHAYPHQTGPAGHDKGCSGAWQRLEAVEKLDNSSDKNKCKTVTESTIYYIQSGSGHDVVLCLKETK
ncbi:LppU/SCO3897 family protein [Streptomyces sp. NBC_00576]|uniref:LppU/SCO3897 family protein n=1 Tax=Streptomyces sp. NBC_00576 TaxID=2903665 RepID=UPI003FCC820B